MTLDEARACLGLSSAAGLADIRDAFRQQARAVHPDRHPEAQPAELERLSREFDRAREARDILVRYTADPLRKRGPAAAPPRPTAKPAPDPTAGTTPQPPSAPRTTRRDEQPPAPRSTPRVTMRFDEFVAWTDAAGFGPGTRAPRYVDWARIVAWSSLGVIVVAVGGALAYVSLTT